MKRFPLICTIWLVASCPSWAGDQGGRFLEFQYPDGKDTKTYDLNTMQIIQPGRFTIVSTTIDNPDVMRFELKVLDTLRSHCARPEGKYPAPADLLTLGPPNMPVQNIEVRSTTLYGSSRSKLVEWQYPYTRLALFNNQPRSLFLHCNDHQDFSEVQNLFMQQRLPHLTAHDVAEIDREVRAMLTQLSVGRPFYVKPYRLICWALSALSGPRVGDPFLFSHCPFNTSLCSLPGNSAPQFRSLVAFLQSV